MLSNNRVRELAKLNMKKYRNESALVIVEGKRLIAQLFHDKIHIEEIFCLENDVKKYAVMNPDRLTICTEPQLAKLSSAKTPQNIAALIKKPDLSLNLNGFLLYLDNISEPGNLGTIFRTAAAFNIDGIVLSPDCCEVYNPKAIRASLGSVFTVPHLIRGTDFLKNTDSEILSTVLEDAEPLTEIRSLKKPIILVIGSEAHGISREIVKMTAKKIYIPMSSRMESLNASIAAAIAIFHINQVIK